MTDSDIERATKRGRRFGTALFALLIGSFTVVCSAQVLYQGFSRKEPSGRLAGNCRTGLTSLAQSLHRACQQAAEAPLTERARLDHFRRSLLPEWADRDAIERDCNGDTWTKTAFSQIDRLRWAEEHAVRYESADLAKSRQLVLAIEKTLGQ